MEHKRITGGEHLLPFARSRIRALRATGMLYASQQFEVDGVSVKVRIEPGHEYIMLDGEQPSLYEFFTTGPVLNTQALLDFSVYRGYGVNVKIDKEKKTLKGIAVGSTLEQSFANPPAWVYRSNANDMSKLMPHKNAFQAQGAVEHQYFPELKPPQFMLSCWTGASQINDPYMATEGMNSSSGYLYDVAYDLAPEIFRRPGYPVGESGLAPDTDWYRRAAMRKVEHPTHGVRWLVLMTDAIGNLHVYPTSECDYSLWDDPVYASQAIKTNVPSYVAQSHPIPFPAWGRKSTKSARENYPYAAELGSYIWNFNSTATRMVSVLVNDSDAKYYAQCDDDTTLSGRPVNTTESLYGMLEVSIDIALTGEKPEDFSVVLSVADEIAPTSETYVIAADYYWGDLPDAKTPGPIARDSLLYITTDIYHKHPEGPPPSGQSEAGYTSMRAQAKVINRKDGAVLREFAMHAADAPYGMDIQPDPVAAPYYMDDPVNPDQGVGGHIKIPLAPYADSFLRAYYDKARKAFDKLVTLFGGATYYRQLLHTEYYALLSTSPPLNCATLAAVDGIIHKHLDACRDAARSYVPPSPVIPWTAENIKKYNEENIRQKFYLARMLGMPEDLITLKTWFLAYDLRILAFATQTAAFKNIGNQTTRQDRIQVIVRNEVVETIDAPDPTFAALISDSDAPWVPDDDWARLSVNSTVNPKDSICGFRAFLGRRNNLYSNVDMFSEGYTSNVVALEIGKYSGIGIAPFTRGDFNVDYPHGAVEYRVYSQSFMSMGMDDIFCIHPAGHWSITIKPIVYYSGVSTHAYQWSSVDNPAIDASAFVQKMVDIVNVRVTRTDEAGEKIVEDYKSKHLDLFNQAYGKNVAYTDFNLDIKYEHEDALGDNGSLGKILVTSPNIPNKRTLTLIPYTFINDIGDTHGVTRRTAPSYFGIRDLSCIETYERINYAGDVIIFYSSTIGDAQANLRGACMFTGKLEQR